ncbi:hypothetical protein Noda2021_03410 [Candidatus Dependentiae bacterium Noda2021]|nr:hypothetical protein Noda2021_03410 [Candidatus Dependentiae bacterium Noda2021]
MKLTHYYLIALFFSSMIISSEKNEAIENDTNTFASAIEIMCNEKSTHPNKEAIAQEIKSYTDKKANKPYHKTIKKLQKLLPESPFELKPKKQKTLKPITIIQPAFDPSSVPVIKNMEDDRNKTNAIGYAFVTLSGFARITQNSHIQPFTTNLQPTIKQLETNLNDYFSGNASTPTTVDNIKTNASNAQSKMQGLQVIQHGISQQQKPKLQPLAVAAQLFLDTNTLQDEAEINLKTVLNKQFYNALTMHKPKVETPHNQPTTSAPLSSEQQFVNELHEYKKIASDSKENVDQLLAVYYKKNPSNSSSINLKFV